MSVVFTSGGSAIIGNAKGGIWGAMIGAFFAALMFTLFPLVYLATGKFYPEGAGNVIQFGWASIDSIIGIIPMAFSYIPNHYIGMGVYAGVIVVVIIGLLIDGIFFNLKNKVDKKSKPIKIDTKNE